uniref:Uncharacterized protein n=1 Tax=Tanacetum cinerariifolium TaxID=118510 RepID=A0A6L2NU85_TANCI|nr:hypothetical protein [Tanacetum cinerariifolium]
MVITIYDHSQSSDSLVSLVWLKLEVPCTLTFELLGPLVLATAGATLNTECNDGHESLYRVATKGGNRLHLPRR